MHDPQSVSALVKSLQGLQLYFVCLDVDGNLYIGNEQIGWIPSDRQPNKLEFFSPVMAAFRHDSGIKLVFGSQGGLVTILNVPGVF